MNHSEQAHTHAWKKYYQYIKSSIRTNPVLSFISVYLPALIHLLPPLERLYRYCYQLLVKPEQVDVLFALSSTDKISRFNGIYNAIKDAGMRVAIVDRKDRYRDALKYVFWPCDRETPKELLLIDKYAHWLADKYQPRIVLIVENAGLFPCVMRKHINAKGGLLINQAHGVGFMGVSHSCIDADYTFVFGQSTIDGLKNNHARIGATTAVITGSPFINADVKSESKKISLSEQTGPVIIAAQYIPAWENLETAVLASRDIISTFIRRNPQRDFVIKPHPLGNIDIWDEIITNNAHVTLTDERNINQVLTGSSLLLHMSSNASIEAGVIGVPSIAVDPFDCSRHLFHDRYLYKVADINELERDVQQVFNDYTAHQQRAHQHADYLVGYRYGTNARTASYLKTLLSNDFLEGEKINESSYFHNN